MKRVFLYAYDKVNLGDDLFIHTIVKRYPHVLFYLWTDVKNRQTFRKMSNLKVLNKNAKIVYLLGKIRASFAARYKSWWEQRCNASVYIGGSIFMEYETWKNQINWLAYQAEKCDFFVIGANFGPYQTDAYREQLGEVFLKMRDVCFRDSYSLNKFSGNPKVRYAPDILFSYPVPRVPIKDKQVLVSVINCSGRDTSLGFDRLDENYVRNMATILQGYLKDGCSLVLASFCQEEGDEKAIQKILAAMDCNENSKIDVITYDGSNREKLIETIVESEFVIASRFHAVILAMIAERPVLPVIYSDKTKHVLEDLKFAGITFDLRKEESWDYALSRQNWNQHIVLDLDKIKKSAQNHFEKLDKLLQ